jgi:ribosomal protein S27E
MTVTEFWESASKTFKEHHDRAGKFISSDPTGEDHYENIADFLTDMYSLASAWYNRTSDAPTVLKPESKPSYVERVRCPHCGSLWMVRVPDDQEEVKCVDCGRNTDYYEANQQWETYDNDVHWP